MPPSAQDPSTLHPLAAQFSEVAESYERGRPEYPPAIVGVIAAELGLAAGAPVLDLGAGTGKFTRALLSAGLDAVAVEPQPALRELLAAIVGSERAREGRAETIPLEDDSVDAVTVADAFHWFDQTAALSEIERVLRPRGGLAVLTSVPDWSGASWGHEVGEMLARRRPAHPHYDGPPWHAALAASVSWGAPREVRLAVSQPAQPERIVDYFASISWIAAMPANERAETLAEVDAIVRAGETPDELKLRVIVGLSSLR